MKVNYHTHSHYCDGKGELAEYVETAIAKGFTHLGFSGHAPVPFENTFAIKLEDYKAYCDEVRRLKEQYRDRIKIYLGLEIDYIPNILDDFGPLIAEGGLEYCIGSVHLVNRNGGSDLWFIDGSKQETYDEGLNNVFGGDIRAGVKAFFNQTCRMIETQRPTIVGHFDKIVMHNKGRYFSPDDPWFHALAMETIDLIRQTGCICEINTRGLYKGRYNDFYPSSKLIEVMNELDIPVVVSTDAHRPDDLDLFEGAYEYLAEIGYRNVVGELGVRN
ncbi:MAG: histidinol-phosphatase [Bacteroidales bacterium]|nr:histidinol-phosphatase [Bacteroidales bacterium]